MPDVRVELVDHFSKPGHELLGATPEVVVDHKLELGAVQVKVNVEA